MLWRGTRFLPEIRDKRKSVVSNLYYKEAQRRAQWGSSAPIPPRNLPPEQIICMNWLAENIMGSIPEYDQLSKTSKASVDLEGEDPVS